MTFVIILACSGKKHNFQSAAAGCLYDGQIFLKGQAIANTHRVPYWILSAKYGIIQPNDIIDNYDQKLTRAYKGPFPPPEYYGFYVGGQSYFKNFPKTFLPLVVPGPIGKMLQRLKHLVDNPDECLEKLKGHPCHATL